MVVNRETLDDRRIDRDDIVELAQGCPGPDAIMEVLVEQQGKVKEKRFVPSGSSGDQRHTFDGLGAIGETTTDLGALEAFVFHRDLDRDGLAFRDAYISGIDHQCIGVGISNIEEGSKSAADESPRLLRPDCKQEQDDASSDCSGENEFTGADWFELRFRIDCGHIDDRRVHHCIDQLFRSADRIGIVAREQLYSGGDSLLQLRMAHFEDPRHVCQRERAGERTQEKPPGCEQSLPRDRRDSGTTGRSWKRESPPHRPP